jgi:hypothetical protein
MLMVVSAAILILFSGRVVWSVNFYSLSAGALLCFVGALIFVGTELTNWAIKTWVAASPGSECNRPEAATVTGGGY